MSANIPSEPKVLVMRLSALHRPTSLPSSHLFSTQGLDREGCLPFLFLLLARFDCNEMPGGKASEWTIDELFDRVPERAWKDEHPAT